MKIYKWSNHKVDKEVSILLSDAAYHESQRNVTAARQYRDEALRIERNRKEIRSARRWAPVREPERGTTRAEPAQAEDEREPEVG